MSDLLSIREVIKRLYEDPLVYTVEPPPKKPPQKAKPPKKADLKVKKTS